MSDIIQRLADTLDGIITNRLAKGRLVLPVLPEAAISALELVQDPEVSLTRVAGALGRDPALAVQIVKAASSAATGGPIKTLVQAVTRIGSTKLKPFIIEACARKLFVAKDQRLAHAMAMVWEHSVAVAILARDLAAVSGCEDSEAAYLSGLLHDVGKPIVAALLLEVERQMTGTISDPATAIAVIQRIHRKVGVAVAESWAMPPEVVTAVRECDDYDPVNRESVVNYVRFANAMAKQQSLYETESDRDDADALVMVGKSLLGLQDDVVESLCADLRERIKLAG